MSGLERELNGLNGDKKVSELAVASSQSQMAEMLKGELGKDMMSVLSGEKKVELPKTDVVKFKVSTWFKNLLRKF